MERKYTSAAVLVVLVPIVVGVAVNLLTPWLQGNAGVIGQFVTSPWFPGLLWGVMAAVWLYYWFGIVAPRMAPIQRAKRFNSLHVEKLALWTAAQRSTSDTMPKQIASRLVHYRREANDLLRSDAAHRIYADVDAICAQISYLDPAAWRAATLMFLDDSDAILGDVQNRVSPAAPRSPRSSIRGR